MFTEYLEGEDDKIIDAEPVTDKNADLSDVKVNGEEDGSINDSSDDTYLEGEAIFPVTVQESTRELKYDSVNSPALRAEMNDRPGKTPVSPQREFLFGLTYMRDSN